MNQVHSLLLLREAKELLAAARSAFNLTNAVDLLETLMNQYEENTSMIREGLQDFFLDLSDARENELHSFLSAREEEIQNLSRRIAQTEITLTILRARINSLQLQIDALSDPLLQEELSAKLMLASSQLNQLQDLISQGRLLLPELLPVLVPFREAESRAADISKEVRSGTLFSEDALSELDSMSRLIETFMQNDSDHSFSHLSLFSDEVFNPFLRNAYLEIDEVDLFLNPPMVQRAIELNHFSIEVLQESTSEEKNRRILERQPDITSFRAFIMEKIPTLESSPLQDGERHQRMEIQRKLRRHLRSFLIMRPLSETENRDPLFPFGRRLDLVIRPMELGLNPGELEDTKFNPLLRADIGLEVEQTV